MSVLLDVKQLKVRFATEGHQVRAVDGVDFRIEAGETLALLGESGSGKSVTALSLTRLLPKSAVVSGDIRFKGGDLLALSDRQMRDIRGGHISMIFQEPQTSLNPALTVGIQVGETLRRHRGLRSKAQKEKVVELLEAVGIPEPGRAWMNTPTSFPAA